VQRGEDGFARGGHGSSLLCRCWRGRLRALGKLAAIVANAPEVAEAELQGHSEKDDAFCLLEAYGRMEGVA
jgi:hypothetical protein